jgi:adenosylhomocysteine nucleosidase
VPNLDNGGVFNADERLIAIAERSKIPTKTGVVVSGDQFINDNEKKKWIYEQFDAMCTEMEGAAIAHVCSLNMVPFVVIRAISDVADDSSHVDFEEFVVTAAKVSSDLCEDMIKGI